MKSKSISLVAIFLELSIILCITSCERQIIIPKEVSITSVEPSKKIPLNAGLYFSQGFRNAKYLINYLGRSYSVKTVDAGDTLCNSSKKIMENIFQKTLTLDSTGSIPGLSSKIYDVIIAPQAVKLEYATEQHGIKAYCLVQTIIKWNIATPEGKEVYVVTIKSDDVKMRIYKQQDAEECIKLSIKSNFQRAQEDIYSSNWWRQQWWKNIN